MPQYQATCLDSSDVTYKFWQLAQKPIQPDRPAFTVLPVKTSCYKSRAVAQSSRYLTKQSRAQEETEKKGFPTSTPDDTETTTPKIDFEAQLSLEYKDWNAAEILLQAANEKSVLGSVPAIEADQGLWKSIFVSTPSPNPQIISQETNEKLGLATTPLDDTETIMPEMNYEAQLLLEGRDWNAAEILLQAANDKVAPGSAPAIETNQGLWNDILVPTPSPNPQKTSNPFSGANATMIAQVPRLILSTTNERLINANTQAVTAQASIEIGGPEKCPIRTCEYHTKGFAQKSNRNQHTVIHYEGTMVCGFCSEEPRLVGTPRPRSIDDDEFHSYPRRRPGRARWLSRKMGIDAFKRHLRLQHPIGQLESSLHLHSKPREWGQCSACLCVFKLQDFIEHLDDCIFREVELGAFRYEIPASPSHRFSASPTSEDHDVTLKLADTEMEALVGTPPRY